jgi:hypothetical protein
MSAGRFLRLLLVAGTVTAALGLPATAVADDGEGREVRKAGNCTGPSEASIRLRTDDGEIRVEFRIDARRAGAWNVILLHERRIAYRGRVPTRSTSRSVRLRRVVADWYGLDTFTVRASGPRSESCRVSATV